MLVIAAMTACSSDDDSIDDSSSSNDNNAATTSTAEDVLSKVTSNGDITTFNVDINKASLSEILSVDENDDDYIENTSFASTITVTFSTSGAATVEGDDSGIIKINGNGDFTVMVGDVTLALTGVNNYIVIDKEQEDVYDSGGSCNEKLSALSLPYLKAGENIISIVGNSSFTVEITPNWRRL